MIRYSGIFWDVESVIMLDRLKITSLFLAVICTGLMAGFFATYSFNVNVAMLELSGAEYTKVQSLFNENVRYAGFFLLFFGTGVILLVASALQLPHYKSSGFLSISIAAVLYIAVIIVYTRFHILPINYTVESWDLSAVPETWTAMRDAWNQANLIRSVVAIGVFILTILSLCNSLIKKPPQ